jgi:MFS family permease
MVGLERVSVPLLAETAFGLASHTAILSFIVSFGIAKALANYAAGRACDRFGRRPVLIAGWLAGVPVPLLLLLARGWDHVLLANALLGVHQGLAWSAAVIMKIDLVGPRRRGLATGLNEAAGYAAVALAALVSSEAGARFGLRSAPFHLGAVIVAAGTLLSLFAPETRAHAALEGGSVPDPGSPLRPREMFARASFGDRNLSAISQAGLANNLNDGVAWGLFPLLFAGAGLAVGEIGGLAALYPACWALAQLGTGALSDRIGRKWLIASGLWLQALAIAWIAASHQRLPFALASLLLGLGTAMVYPTLLAAIGDVTGPSWRASAVGVYRLWRDLGYAVGALMAGAAADALGLRPAILLTALVTLLSGTLVAARMRDPSTRAGH